MWQSVDGYLADDQGARIEEGQTVEFKTSLAEKDAGIQTLVAFANAQGGRVFFGIKDDGEVVGVDVGSNTWERLANEIKDRTYPTLPVFMEDPLDCDGRKVVIVESPKDVPPVVGVYLCRTRPIPPDGPVDANTLQAYRRVGRTTQKVDFMQLRMEQRSDPRLRLVADIKFAVPLSDANLSGVVWVEEASGTAHNVTFTMEPPLYVCENRFSDLPYQRGRQEEEEALRFMRMYRISYASEYAGAFRYTAERLPRELPSHVTLIARFFDDWGLMWEASRVAKVVLGGSKRQKMADRLVDFQDGGQFRRRIVTFPAKAEYGSAP